MTKEDFAKGMAFLSGVYSKSLTPEQLAIWYTFFETDTLEEFQRAVRIVSVRSKFMPSIAELKEAIAEDAVGMIPADQAWDKVLYAIRKFGWCQADDAMKSLPPVAQLTVNHLGGFKRICESEDLEWTRKDFMKIYDTNKNREQFEYTTGTLVSIADVVARRKRLEAGNS